MNICFWKDCFGGLVRKDIIFLIRIIETFFYVSSHLGSEFYEVIIIKG